LHEIDPALDHRLDRADRGVDRGEPGGQVADEGRTVLGPGALEELVDRAHHASLPSSRPKYVAAVCTSLSPRPERFTRIVASGPISCASMRAPASACADSMAG